MPKHWTITPTWEARTDAARRLGLSPLVTQLLYNRGVVESSAVREFLNPQLSSLHPPDLLPGAVAAAEVICRKIRDRCPIVIYGDYDVDGITGTSILWHVLRLAGARVDYYIPHRLEEGYGLNAEALRQIRAGGADTVVTVDCGITAVEEAKVARELGLTLIITDHHTPGPTLPDADVLVHPRIGTGYPNTDICGAGVAFKVAWAIARGLCNAERVTPEFRQFLLDATALVALGTIADVVPLVGENRVLARFGLMGLRESKLTGIQALIESAKLANEKLNSEHVGFWLAPRLNAAGRMGHAQLAVEMLTRADEARAREIAAYLEDQNRGRQNTERRITREACEQIEKENLASDGRRAIVLAGRGWHAGVVGIVASRIVDQYRRPTVMICLDECEGQGSARSIRHFHLHEALTHCAEHLLAYGGHAMAAGLRIKPEKVERFTEAFIERANQTLTGKDLLPSLRLDAQVRLEELTESAVRELERMAPFGMGNPKPRFATDWLQLDGEPRAVGANGDHLQFSVSDGQTRRKAIAFRAKEHLQTLLDRRRCRVAFEPILNTFNGRTSVELQVIDLNFPEE